MLWVSQFPGSAQLNSPAGGQGVLGGILRESGFKSPFAFQGGGHREGGLAMGGQPWVPPGLAMPLCVCISESLGGKKILDMCSIFVSCNSSHGKEHPRDMGSL